MANTYTQLHIHIVFAVKRRANLIGDERKDKLYKYITRIVTNKSQKLLQVNGMPDHIHILIGIKPTCVLSDLVREIKTNSTKWIHEKGLVNGKFSWQTGFGAFTVGHSQLDRVINYIKNQEEHHRKKTFKQEYVDSLNENGIDYDEYYIFQ